MNRRAATGVLESALLGKGSAFVNSAVAVCKRLSPVVLAGNLEF